MSISKFLSVMARIENGMRRATPIATLFLMLPFAGCSSTPGSAGSRTPKQTEMGVSCSMTRFRNGVQAGVVTRGEQEQVNKAYANFEAAFREALEAAHNNRNAATPDNVKALATEVIAGISAIPF